MNTYSDGNGYVLSHSIRGSDINMTNILTGKKKTIPVDEKHVIFYSPAYAKKAKAERSEVLKKAQSLINEPQKYNRSTLYGAAKYISNIDFDKKTGKVYTDTGKSLELNQKLIEEEEKYDGCYAIVTSEVHLSDEKITEIYRGLWKIEESLNSG